MSPRTPACSAPRSTPETELSRSIRIPKSYLFYQCLRMAKRTYQILANLRGRMSIPLQKHIIMSGSWTQVQRLNAAIKFLYCYHAVSIPK